jgi:hypothetical protein
MPVVEAPPPLLAAEPPVAAFPAGGWKRGFQLKLTLIGTAVPLRVYLTYAKIAIPEGGKSIRTVARRSL